jgi:hypothetical protein
MSAVQTLAEPNDTPSSTAMDLRVHLSARSSRARFLSKSFRLGKTNTCSRRDRTENHCSFGRFPRATRWLWSEARDFTVRDPEGNLWAFGTYRPQVGED